MKVEAGMYVRTYGGFICKVIGIDLEFVPIGKFVEVDIETNNILFKDNTEHYYTKHYYFNTDNDIKQASYNIIDLIEVGDYVNGYRITNIDKSIEDTIIRLFTDDYDYDIYNDNIKSILTKEQFESMKYEVE